MLAKELYDYVYQKQAERLCELDKRIKAAENPSAEITACIKELVQKAYDRCIAEMEEDHVLEYTINGSFKVVDYSILKQMGVALGAVKDITKANRDACNYGEPYYHVHIVGLSKLIVEVKIKKRLGILKK